MSNDTRFSIDLTTQPNATRRVIEAARQERSASLGIEELESRINPLLVVIAIIAVLIGLLLPAMQ
jgi:hypothetical protein